MEKKYKLTKEYKIYEGRKVYRIQALRDFGDVKAGDLGGYVKSKKNLSQEGKCWIYDDAIVTEQARVTDSGKVFGSSIVKGKTVVKKTGEVLRPVASGLSTEHEITHSYFSQKYKLTNEKIIVDGHVLYRIKALCNFGNVKAGDLGGFIENEKNLSHIGNCWIYDNGKAYGSSSITDDATVRDEAEVCGYTKLKDEAEVSGNAFVYLNLIEYKAGMGFGPMHEYGVIGHDSKISGDSKCIGAIGCGSISINPIKINMSTGIKIFKMSLSSQIKNIYGLSEKVLLKKIKKSDLNRN